MKAIHWESPARAEYEHALAMSPSAGAFQQAVEEALQDIATGRVIHAQVPRSPARQCILKTPPYSII